MALIHIALDSFDPGERFMYPEYYHTMCEKFPTRL